MTTAALIVAAGRGTRAGGDTPKQWRALGHGTVASHAIAAFAQHPRIDRVVLVIHPDDLELASDWPAGSPVELVQGGADRAASVKAGLQALYGQDITQVLIHDVARPLVPAEVIDRVLDGLRNHDAAAPALAVTDALWRGAETVEGMVPRDGLWRAQTPQGFAFAAIHAAHQAHQGGAADDVEVARAAGMHVAIVPGDERNFKITGPGDFARAEEMLAQATQEERSVDVRLGNGYDVHRFCEGDHVWLCGVKVPHSHGLDGHSDADVAMHALTDAIYGALAEGDIGRHFPPSDPQWKGAASDIFLSHAGERLRARGFSLGNADVTIICEDPKIGPHAGAMIARLAAILQVSEERVSVKATTSERLGFTGRREGIAAIATATLVKP